MLANPISSIPLGLCQCGCGGKTNIAARSHTKQGTIKGQPVRFIASHGTRKPSHLEKYQSLNMMGPFGICQCGCGQRTEIADISRTARGWVKGYPKRVVSGHGSRKYPHADNIKKYQTAHFTKSSSRFDRTRNTSVHTVIAETALGKRLPPQAVVHHANGLRGDNRNNNLVICEDAAYHQLLHHRMKALAACGNPNFRKCQLCKTWCDPNIMYQYPNKQQAFKHKECSALYIRTGGQMLEKGDPSMRLLEIKKISVKDIQHSYGVSRRTIETLISNGWLTPERIHGGKKRYFSPAQVDNCFRTIIPQTRVLDLRHIADLTTAQLDGAAPTRTPLH